MENSPQKRLKAFSNILQDRHENLEWAEITFDPCAGAAGLPIQAGFPAEMWDDRE